MTSVDHVTTSITQQEKTEVKDCQTGSSVFI